MTDRWLTIAATGTVGVVGACLLEACDVPLEDLDGVFEGEVVRPADASDVMAYVPDPSICETDATIPTLEVRVRSSTGIPACDATVTATPADGASTELVLVETAECTYFGDPPPADGPYLVEATRAGCSPVSESGVWPKKTACAPFPGTTRVVLVLDEACDVPDGGSD